MGDSDVDTFANITRADYDFDDEAFEAVTQNAKDFISSLLVHRKEERLSAKQCLESVWLSQQNDESSSKIRICTDKLKKFIIRRKWQVCTFSCDNSTQFSVIWFSLAKIRSFTDTDIFKTNKISYFFNVNVNVNAIFDEP